MPLPPLTDHDKALFQEAVRDVVPLKQEKQRRFKKPVSARATFPRPPSPSREKLTYTERDLVQSETLLSSKHPSLPHKRYLALKQGKLPIEARLDLHGLMTSEAEDRLVSFIQRAKSMGKQCVLIIHGKGGREGEAPVLKNHVNQWLKQIPQVLAFHSAQPRDGGSGALYVLL